MLWRTTTLVLENHPMWKPTFVYIILVQSFMNNVNEIKNRRKNYDCKFEVKWKKGTCKTTLLDKTMTAAMRYKQPTIFSLSKTTSGGGDVNWASFMDFVPVLCIMLIVIAPITHSNVPMIFTLLYKHLKFSLSNLHHTLTFPY